MTFRLDMTMMFAMHDALRRELERIARITARTDDDPRRVLRTAAGWELFKTFLRVHHTSEDVALWPVMRHELASRPDGLALLEAMEAEHAAIDPLLAGVDAALADRDHGGEILGGLVDALVTGLSGHLRHEETEGLALIDASLDDRQWLHFAEIHRERIGGEVPRYLPWLLDGADARTTALILDRLPAPVRTAYHDEWRAAYTDLNLYP
ncbi:hemerythrin domain-containing protein [Streptosporangium sp. NPDC049248]|uniref:hemerythrin domain-containing protein n=1 Tax=Streptosporangium sp. NPDC049248 TaxID=3155651 RepID=UPI0034386216